MKSLLFYICIILGFGFVASQPNRNEAVPKTENVAPLRPKSTKRDTPPRLPDTEMHFANMSVKDENEEIRLYNFDVNDGYLLVPNTEGVLDSITLQMDGWLGAFNLRKPAKLDILHFPNDKRDGKVFHFGEVPIKQFKITIPVRDIWYGHFLLQFTQADSECKAEYSFWLHSPTNFTKVIFFKPDFTNCKFPQK